MTLTTAEEERLQAAEDTIKIMFRLVEGASSYKMLNKLIALATSQIDKLTQQVEALETIATKILTLARKVQ
jgi:hypothetical protein